MIREQTTVLNMWTLLTLTSAIYTIRDQSNCWVRIDNVGELFFSTNSNYSWWLYQVLVRDPLVHVQRLHQLPQCDHEHLHL